MIIESPLDLVFRDLFLKIRGFVADHDVFLKLEGFNVTGSIKIKTAKALIQDAEKRHGTRPGKTTFVESSSGNLGVALSLVCAILGYDFICVTDTNATKLAIRAMRAHGAEVVVVSEPDRNGGYLGTRLAMIQSILAQNENAVWLDQHSNVANKDVHAQETAMEILNAFPQVDWIFAGTGTTGTLAGISSCFRSKSPGTRIIAVDAEGSVSFGGSPKLRLIPGIGASRRPPLADLCQPDEVVLIPEAATVGMCREFARTRHLLIGGSTGSILCAVTRYADRFGADETIVALSPDFGDKYLETIYDDDWVEQNISVSGS